MSQRDEWITSPGIVDTILVFMIVEWIILVAYHRSTGRGIAPGDFSLNLLSGMFLLLAFREALVAAWWGWVMASLTGALLAHVADLRRRWVH